MVLENEEREIGYVESRDQVGGNLGRLVTSLLYLRVFPLAQRRGLGDLVGKTVAEEFCELGESRRKSCLFLKSLRKWTESPFLLPIIVGHRDFKKLGYYFFFLLICLFVGSRRAIKSNAISKLVSYSYSPLQSLEFGM